MSRSEIRLHDKQKGVALLVVWILVVALVVTMATVFYRHQLTIAAVTGHTRQEQALLLALGTENWSTGMLAADYDDASTDHLEEDWARPVPALPVEGGFISGCMLDMQGRFNVNSLAFYNEERYANEFRAEAGTLDQASTFLALIQSTGMPANPGMAGMLADWTDADIQPLSDWATGEQPAYDAALQRVMVPNSLMVETAELTMLAGFDGELVERLLPFVSALPAETPVNINTASEVLLFALAGDQGERFTEFVMQSRPFASTQAFRQALTQFLALEPGEADRLWSDSRISVASDFFALMLQVQLDNMQLEITSLLDRRGSDRPVVIQRTINRVPRIDTSALDEDEMILLSNPCAVNMAANS